MKNLLILFLGVFSFVTIAGPKYEVNGLEISNENGQIQLEVKLSSNTKVRHKVEIRDNFIQLELTDTFVRQKSIWSKRFKELEKFS